MNERIIKKTTHTHEHKTQIIMGAGASADGTPITLMAEDGEGGMHFHLTPDQVIRSVLQSGGPMMHHHHHHHHHHGLFDSDGEDGEMDYPEEMNQRHLFRPQQQEQQQQQQQQQQRRPLRLLSNETTTAEEEEEEEEAEMNEEEASGVERGEMLYFCHPCGVSFYSRTGVIERRLGPSRGPAVDVDDAIRRLNGAGPTMEVLTNEDDEDDNNDNNDNSDAMQKREEENGEGKQGEIESKVEREVREESKMESKVESKEELQVESKEGDGSYRNSLLGDLSVVGVMGIAATTTTASPTAATTTAATTTAATTTAAMAATAATAATPTPTTPERSSITSSAPTPGGTQSVVSVLSNPPPGSSSSSNPMEFVDPSIVCPHCGDNFVELAKMPRKIFFNHISSLIVLLFFCLFFFENCI